MSMTKEEAISLLTQVNKILVNSNSWSENTHEPLNMAFDMAIESIRDMAEIEEIINCDADAETKCRMISNILTAKPHYFEET